MKRIISVLFTLLLLAPFQTTAAPAEISEQGKATLSGFLRSAVESGDIPGVVALVVSPDRVLYHEAFGKLNVARNIAMPKDAIFRVASMTKPITSVAAMMLIENGQLSLDDPVSKYLPEFKDRQVIENVNAENGTYATRRAARQITIRHLLTHTSGIGYAWSDPRLQILQQKTGLPEPELPLLHDPGARWTYGAGTRVIGYVIEKISGQPLDVFLDTRIFKLLGMTDISYVVPPDKEKRLVTVHQRRNGRLEEQESPPPLALRPPVRGDGGLNSTAADYGLFLQMLLNQGRSGSVRLLKPESVRAMTQNQIDDLVIEQQPVADTDRSRPYPLGAGTDKWGLGFQLSQPKTNTPFGRSRGSYSWAGINNTHFWVDPDKQIAVVLLMQVLPFYDDACIRVLRGFEERLYRNLN